MNRAERLASLFIAATLLLGLIGCAGSSNINEVSNTGSDKNVNSIGEGIKMINESVIDLQGRKIIVTGTEGLKPIENDPKHPDEISQKRIGVRLDRQAEAEKKFNCIVEWKTVTPDEMKNNAADIKAGIYVGDIIYTYPSFGSFDLVRRNLVAPLDEYIDFNSGYYSNTAQGKTLWRGKHYGLVDSNLAGGATLTYNKAMISSEGLQDPYKLMEKGQWTWDAFRDILIKTTKDINEDGVTDQWGLETTYDNFSKYFIYTNGEDYIKDENSELKSNLDSPEIRKALQFVKDIYQTDKVVVDRNVNNKLYVMGEGDMFSKGKAAFGGYGKLPDFEVGYVTYPKGPDASGYVLVGTQSFFSAIPSNVEDKKAVAAVMACLFSWMDTSKENYFDTYGDVKSKYTPYFFNLFLNNTRCSWFISDPTYSKITKELNKDIFINKKPIDEAIEYQRPAFEDYVNVLNSPE